MNTVYWRMNATQGGANLHPGVNLLPGAHNHCFSLISICVRRLSDNFQLPTLWCGSPQINESHSGINNFILNKRRIYIFIESHHHIQVTFPFISVVHLLKAYRT